ncbi:hypothetical protein [Streptomyces sp. NPDC057429]|uniref:hypothetical protein n=1 Tax=Streptomyces sp. NPDC057429 TaxID=3346130 RepID=UPI0036C0A110
MSESALSSLLSSFLNARARAASLDRAQPSVVALARSLPISLSPSPKPSGSLTRSRI